MKNKKGKNNKTETKGENFLKLKTETKHGILAVIFFVLALFFLMSVFELAGVAGEFVYDKLHYLLGIGYILLPFLFILLGSSFIKSETPNVGWARVFSSALFLLSSLGLVDIASDWPAEAGKHSGGILGEVLSMPLVALFDVYASIAFLGAILIISILVMFDAKLELAIIWKKILAIFKKEKVDEEGDEENPENADDPSISLSSSESEQNETEKESKSAIEKAKEALGMGKKSGSHAKNETEEEMPIRKKKGVHASTYNPPPLSLLEEDKGKPNTGDIKANANIIKKTLANFGIEVEMDEITIGPTVTRYALKPAENVRLSKIVALQRELELALAAHPIRIEAPIPGKSLVGIEVPNNIKATVGLATMLGSAEFTASDKPLLMSLGRDLAGKAHFANLSKMPHALIAGATGAGKSVTLHTILTSLLFRNAPEDLKLILIDPKRVELTLYNKIPHLLTPVITDAKKAILALKWAGKEMDRRYDVLESESVRDIHSYHKN